jgi:protein-S-isoprenylcysteine O-methyltransferase Ste14
MATRWEFANRAVLFGLIISLAFACYLFDRNNVTALLSDWLAARYQQNAEFLARVLFLVAALLLASAALLRTWASAYLNAQIVYASDVKSTSLAAGGPYRWVRNPLYFANLLMAVALGALMNRSGCIVVVLGMLIFCYRLILREEAELSLNLGEYAAYRKAVPRFWPSPIPRIPSSQQPANWSAGLKAECWYWGFVLGLAVFAITLNLGYFFLVATFSVLFFWFSPRIFKSTSVAQVPTQEQNLSGKN